MKGDLNQEEFVQELFSTIIDNDMPTLVLSELVLAYLSTPACDNLLRQCATLFQKTTTTNSCVLLYEPLGPLGDEDDDKTKGGTEQNESSSSSSVLEAYQRSYYRQFNSKLQRGRAQPNNKSGNEKDDQSQNADATTVTTVHPLGVSCRSVEQRLREAGLTHAHAALAGRVAASMPHQQWKAREQFDEHAALALHLSSYAVVCGFGVMSAGEGVDDSSSDHSLLFRRFVCGDWAFPGSAYAPRPIRLRKSSSNTNAVACWLTTIERCDESQVRRLFEATYKHLFDKYPAVRKMVKSALRKDLGVGSSGGRTSDHHRGGSSMEGRAVLLLIIIDC